MRVPADDITGFDSHKVAPKSCHFDFVDLSNNQNDVAQVLGLLFSVDDITGFEITKAIELPQPYGIVFLWGVLLPSLFILANALTSLGFKDALIVKVPALNQCPLTL